MATAVRIVFLVLMLGAVVYEAYSFVQVLKGRKRSKKDTTTSSDDIPQSEDK